MQAAQK